MSFNFDSLLKDTDLDGPRQLDAYPDTVMRNFHHLVKKAKQGDAESLEQLSRAFLTNKNVPPAIYPSTFEHLPSGRVIHEERLFREQQAYLLSALLEKKGSYLTSINCYLHNTLINGSEIDVKTRLERVKTLFAKGESDSEVEKLKEYLECDPLNFAIYMKSPLLVRMFIENDVALKKVNVQKYYCPNDHDRPDVVDSLEHAKRQWDGIIYNMLCARFAIETSLKNNKFDETAVIPLLKEYGVEASEMKICLEEARSFFEKISTARKLTVKESFKLTSSTLQQAGETVFSTLSGDTVLSPSTLNTTTSTPVDPMPDNFTTSAVSRLQEIRASQPQQQQPNDMTQSNLNSSTAANPPSEVPSRFKRRDRPHATITYGILILPPKPFIKMTP